MGEAASFFEGLYRRIGNAITPLCINLFIHLVAFDFDAGRAKNVKSIRSISFPSRTHPSSQRIESLFTHLKPHYYSSQSFSSTICFDAETIQKGLVVLAELYNFMEELLQSTQTQQALLHHQDGKIVEEELSIVDQLHCLMLVVLQGIC
ncbi:hypothetical protein S83_067367, partial [Arachis hypogaea]